MLAFDLPDAGTRDRTIEACRHQGLMVLPCGTHSIRFRPYLDLNKEDAAQALRFLDQALDSLQ